jgi:hypothetical protein
MSEDLRKKVRAVGLRFPFINLETAIERAQQFRVAAGDHAILTEDAKQAWGYRPKSSGGDQTAAALRYYGLLDREGTGRLKLTDSAKRYLRDERPEVRAKLRQELAFKPKMMNDLWDHWKSDPPSDTSARSILRVDFNCPDKSADEVLRIYRDNLAFAGVPLSGILSPDSAVSDSQRKAVVQEESPRRLVRVGDHVQWISGGQDQFSSPKRVNWISEDGTHARVFGSMTGIPTSELTVVDSPSPPAAGQAKKTASSGYAGQDGELNVLLRGNRLEITADVDRAGLARLKEILGKYEEILELIDPPS